MNQNIRTGLFVGAASLVVLLALFLQPRQTGSPSTDIGQNLFADFGEPTDAKTIAVARFDEDSSKLQRISIGIFEGNWSILSNKNYPADGSDSATRVRKTAIDMAGLTVLQVASELSSDHAELGVLEPTDDTVKSHTEGIGTMVTLEDGDESALSKLIVGKEVAGTDGQRFVRKVGDDRVYVAKIDVSDLSTKFEDWIEADLLKLNKMSVTKVVLKDYKFDIELALTQFGVTTSPDYQPRLDVTLDKEDDGWKLNKLYVPRGKALVRSKLAANEKLNQESLDGLVDALADLRIVNVRAKPSGLSADLKMGKALARDEQTMKSLMTRGFFMVSTGDGASTMLSSEGEVQVSTKDDVQIILRFGRPSGVGDSKKAALNRYLLVSARVDEAALNKPPKMQLPPSPHGTPHGRPPFGGPGGDEGDDGETGEEGTTEAAAATETTEPPATTETQPPRPPAAGGNGGIGGLFNDRASPAEKARLAKEIRRSSAKRKAKELNERFGDWYYIISEDVYKKIHLGRFDIIVEDETKDGSGVGDFRALEGGIDAPKGPVVPQP